MYVAFDPPIPPLNTHVTYTREQRLSLIDNLRAGVTLRDACEVLGAT